MKKLLLLLALCLFSATVFTQALLEGKINDANTGEAIIFASVALYQDSLLVTGTETDFDGHYRFWPLAPGSYDLEISYVGYTRRRFAGVRVLADKANRQDIALESAGVMLEAVYVVEYKVPLITQDNTTCGYTVRSERRKTNRKKQKPSAGQPPSPLAQQSPEPRKKGLRQSAVAGKADTHGESYAPIAENPFVLASQSAFSTFSIDVDRAAYSNVRRFLEQDQFPPVDAVRTEELINYFDYDYPQPEGEHPLAAYISLAECPWQPGHWLLQIGLKGQDIRLKDAPASHLVFLIDVSGSMGGYNRLPLVKQALSLLVEQLRPQDRISIVTYAGSFTVLLEAAPGDKKAQIRTVIDSLSAGGGTAGGPALQRAYELASSYFLPEGNNRIILATDGDFNIGISSPQELEAFITEKRQTGIYLSVLGFGMGNYKDDRLERLANKGNGNYAYIDKLEEAEKLFLAEGSGTLFTIAEDVKLQVEFDPTQVESYRLIGYENRLLEQEDFEDDTKDAGELGAGHTVTALYELKPSASQTVPEAPPAVIHVRYKRPRESQSYYFQHPSGTAIDAFGQAPEPLRFAAAVAGFCLLLRDSANRGACTYGLVLQMAENARQDDLEGHREAFLELVKKAQSLHSTAAKNGMP